MLVLELVSLFSSTFFHGIFQQILADVGKFVGRDHNKRLLEDRVAIVSFLLWHMVNQFFFVN